MDVGQERWVHSGKGPNFVRAVTWDLLIAPLEHFKKEQHSKTPSHRAFGVPLAAPNCTEWNNLAYDISAQVYGNINGIFLSLIPFSALPLLPLWQNHSFPGPSLGCEDV